MQQHLTTTRPTGRERAVGWARESDLKVAQTAIQTHIHDIRRYCSQHDYDLVHIVTEEGISGRLLDRNAILTLFEMAARGEMDVVVAPQKSRISRAMPWHRKYIEHKLEQCGVRVEYVRGTLEYEEDSVEAVLAEGLSDLLPAIEWAVTRANLRAGQQARAEEGFTCSTLRQFGYEWHLGGQKHGYWSIVESEARWVKEIFKLAAEGTSLRAICRYLEEHNVRTVQGKHWWPETLRNMLKNPKYKGDFIPLRWQAIKPTKPYVARKPGREPRQVKSSHRPRAVEGQGKAMHYEHLRIVADEVWEAANAMLARNKALSTRRTKQRSPLHGLVVCGHHERHQQDKRMFYYRAKGHPARWACNGRVSMVEPVCGASIPAAKLETAVLLRLIDLATDPKRVMADFMHQQAAMAARHARARDMIAAAEAIIQQHQDALARLDADHALGRISDERHDRAVALVEAELQQARADLETCRADIMADGASNLLETPEGWEHVVALVAQQHGADAAESLVEHALRSGLANTSSPRTCWPCRLTRSAPGCARSWTASCWTSTAATWC